MLEQASVLALQLLEEGMLHVDRGYGRILAVLNGPAARMVDAQTLEGLDWADELALC